MSTILGTTSSSTNTNTRLAQLTSAGTVSVTSGSAVVTGSSTTFNTAQGLSVGSLVTINGETKRVKSISSNTSLTVDSAFSATASSQTMTYYTRDSLASGLGVFFIRARTTNTGNLVVGQSVNTVKDGTDVTATTGCWILTPGEITPPISYNDLRDWFVQSSVASQTYNLLIN